MRGFCKYRTWGTIKPYKGTTAYTKRKHDMIAHIIAINATSDDNTFASVFAEAAHEREIPTRTVSSQDCALAIEPDSTVAVFHENERIGGPEDGVFIKSYKGDAYGTYLLEKALRKSSGALFTDAANAMSANTADKMTVTVTLPIAGLPVPASILCTAHSFARNEATIRERLPFPCVLKKTGSRGKQVWKIEDEAQLRERLMTDDELTLLQEYIPNDHDFRVFVLDGEILAAIKRSTADGFYNNVSQGGTATSGDITAAEAAMCIAATDVACLRLSGVDFVRRADGSAAIFEVNKNPQLDIFNAAAGFDLERAVSERVIEQLRRG